MKRFDNLYEKIISIENLTLADRKARKGKKNKYGIVVHDRNRKENILKLHQQLKDGKFKTSTYEIFTIYEPKERIIYRLPYYPDRILHHAILNILEPIWVSIFTADTYCCIKGRGIHLAVKKLKEDLRYDPEGTKYCLKIDVRKFYPSIDHGVLKQIIRRKIKDADLLLLLDEIIDSAPGVPIGNYLSQFFANLYLAYFDHYAKEVMKLKYYYRYADDIVILNNDKKYLHSVLVEINHYMVSRLNLQLKDNYQVFPVESRSVDFLGYRFYHTHILLRKSIKQNFCHKIAKMNKRLNVSEKEYDQIISSWWSWAKHCNSRHLMQVLNEKSRYQIKFN